MRRYIMTPPRDTNEGAARIWQAVTEVFDRKDGTGADWQLLSESLFRAGFQIIEQKLEGENRAGVLRRIHEYSYTRLSAADGDSEKGASEEGLAPSASAHIKTPAPRPKI